MYQVETGCKKQHKLRYQLLLDAYLANCTARQRAMLEMQDKMWSQEGLFAQVSVCGGCVCVCLCVPVVKAHWHPA